MTTQTVIGMAVTGGMGFIFFLVSNVYRDRFKRATLLTASIQLVINALVHVTWKQGWRETHYWMAGIGMIVPLVMATITVVRVIIPALFRRR